MSLPEQDAVDAASFLAIDFETANGSRASACAVGLALFRNGQLVEQRGGYIDPRIHASDWDSMNMDIHGITPDEVAGAPSFASVWRGIEERYLGVPLVAHYAQFDMAVLRAEFRRAAIAPRQPLRYACSWNLARAAWPELVSVRLAYIAEHLEIELDHHDPASDAQAAGRVFAAAVDRLGSGDGAEALLRTNRRWGEIRIDLTYETGWLGSSPEALVPNPDADPGSELFGIHVAFTGEGHMVRRDLQRMVADRGGTPQTNVTKKTNLLVAGHQNLAALAPGRDKSGKYRRAEALRAGGQDIQVVSDLEFQQML